ncbi:transmembrane protein 6/97 [Flammula alnicola]|nr:transmembrane protein 6/97 [Flammula alnicola]
MARPLDMFYFLFFAIHLPASFIVDLQYLYPPQLVPPFMRGLLNFYVDMSRDPLIGGIAGAFGDSAHLTWFKTFIVLEALFQIPVFVLGLRGLYRGSRKIYPLLALYGASSATTTLACLTTVIQTPSLPPNAMAKLAPGVTPEQRLLLLSSYVPFFLVPLIMAVDMALRVAKLAEKGIQAEDEEKWK